MVLLTRKRPSLEALVCLVFISEYKKELAWHLLSVAVIEMKFETGAETFKDLELGMFVGSGRFIIEQGKPVTVEYKVSKVAKGD